jgi:hypothetical protein
MKIHVLYDTQGEIISASVPLPVAYDMRTPDFGVVVEDGQYADELEVPAEFSRLGLGALAERLRVQTGDGAARLAARDA